jgi:uncharacterized membrane protein
MADGKEIPEKLKVSKMDNKPLIAAGTLMGIGMGGFVDGILLHQIFQLHSMLSAKLPQDNVVNIKISMVWDGLFHALTWIVTAVSVALLWNVGRKSDISWSGRILSGSLLMGWGIFNLVEGMINHFLLQIHHVVERLGLSVYDYLFIGSAVLFIIIGFLIIRLGSKEAGSKQSDAVFNEL